MNRIAFAGSLLFLAAAGLAATEKSARNEVVVPAATTLEVRLDEALDTSRNRPGDRFSASLLSPIVVDRKVVIPKGTRFRGRVTSAKPSGRLRGRGNLDVTLDSFVRRGQTYRIRTSTPSRVTESHRKRNLAWVGGGSAGGALVAGLAAGGPWALAGAGIGAGAGAAAALFTGKRQVTIPAESVMRFALKAPVRLERTP